MPPVQGSIAANPGTYTGSILNHYAVNWVSLPTSGSPYQVTLNNTAAGGQLRGSLVCDTGSTFNITPFAAVVSAGGSANIASFNAAGCTSVVAVITNQEQTSGNPNACTAHSYTLAGQCSRGYGNTDCDKHRHGATNEHINQHTNANCNRYNATNKHGNQHTNANEYGATDEHINQYANANRNRHKYGATNEHGNQHSNADQHAHRGRRHHHAQFGCQRQRARIELPRRRHHRL